MGGAFRANVVQDILLDLYLVITPDIALETIGGYREQTRAYPVKSKYPIGSNISLSSCF